MFLLQNSSYAKSIMPLLLDTWSEALLSSGSGLKSAKLDNTGSRQVHVRADVAPILEAVVKTMHLLVDHLRTASEDQDQAAQVLGCLPKSFVVHAKAFIRYIDRADQVKNLLF